MAAKQSAILFAFLCFTAIALADSSDCSPRTLRLMLGERYASPFTSQYTATLTYQTYGECTSSGVVFLSADQETSQRTAVHSQWDAKFCHNKKKNCEQVQYDQYIHTIRIAAEPLKQFIYKVCNDVLTQTDCTDVYSSTMPIGSGTKISAAPMKILFFGDHDNSKAGMVTFDSLYKTMEKETFDAFLFLGDYGYEFYQDNGKVGDDYIDNLTRINTAAPMAITAGNHEDNYNFEFFNQKFQMMNFNETKNNYYSFEIGQVHFISLNLHYYNDQATTPIVANQLAMLAWVEKDLKSIDRTRTPWVIVFGHKMIYCKGSDCDDFARDYAPFDLLLNKYNVDLFISGHKHKFQVMKPVKKFKAQSYTLSDDNTMSNFSGFPTVIQGNGGTSKADDDVDPVETAKVSFVQSMLQKSSGDDSEKLFTSAVQKKSMLYEVQGLGFGKLTVLDEHTLKVESYDSVTNQIIYTISFQK